MSFDMTDNTKSIILVDNKPASILNLSTFVDSLLDFTDVGYVGGTSSTYTDANIGELYFNTTYIYYPFHTN